MITLVRADGRTIQGPILSVGDEVSLALDGHPIKRWRVGPTDEAGPIISGWKVSAVRAESLQPLVVTLVRGTLEAPAGNRLGSRFETSIYAPSGPAADAVVPFAVVRFADRGAGIKPRGHALESATTLFPWVYPRPTAPTQ